MGQRFKDPATGKIYEAVPGGYVEVTDAAPVSIPLGRDPYKTAAEGRAVAEEQRKEATAPAEAQKASAEARIAEANAAIAAAKSDTDLKIAQANLAKTQAEIAQQTGTKGHAIDALQKQLDRVSELYRANIKEGLPNPVWGRIPTSTNEQFTSAAQGLVNPFQAAFRIPGVGAQSDTELRQFIEANTPTPHDTDLQIEEKIGNIQRRIDSERGTDTAPTAQPPSDNQSANDLGLAKGNSRAEIDPALKALGQRVGSMIAKGVPDKEVRDFIKNNGVDPAATNIGGILSFRRTKDFTRWQRANPGKSYPIGADFYTKQIPMTPTRKLANDISQSPVGAFNAASANAIAGGRLDDLVAATGGSGDMAQTGMDMLRTNHPIASVLGDAAGQTLVEDTLGRIPGARGLLATRWGRRGADALYGAYSGSGEDNADPLGGALTGAATNLGFGMLGRSAQRGAGRTMAGVKNKALQYLDNSGVPLTLGQIGRGSDNIVGRTVGGLEERAMGLPGFDAVIGKARQRGDQGFNRAAFRKIGGSGLTGAEGMQEGGTLVDNAYNFLNGAQIPLDAQYAGTNAGIRAAIPVLPKYGEELAKALDITDSLSKGGVLKGRDWQSALRAAKADAASIHGQPFADRAYNFLGDTQDNLVDLATRQGPPGAVDDLRAANRLYSQYRTLGRALDNGPAQMGELFSPKRLDAAALANTRGYGGQIAAVTGNRPFYALTTAGKEVMPNLTPDSGTAGRMLLAPVIAGAGGAGIGALTGGDNRADSAELGAGYGATLAALAGGVYSKPAQKIIQKVLLGDRPRSIQRLGDYLINRTKLASALASAMGRDYVYQPELPQ